MSGEFLTTLFADEFPGQLLLWELAGRRSHWFADAGEATQFASGKTDIYFGCVLQNLERALVVATEREAERAAIEERDARIITQESTRGFADTTVAASCLWLDVDFASPNHSSGKPLPPSRAAAENLIATSKYPKPTVTIFTGGGFQLFWYFKELWVFEDNDDRNAFATLSRKWNEAHRFEARRAGYDLDIVADLARIMRIPGTYNGKQNGKVLVEIVEHDWLRTYDPRDFDDYLPAEVAAIQIDATTESRPGFVKVEIRPDASPPFDLWNALIEIDETACDTYNRNRPDLSDQSPSSYCYSLARVTARYKWAPQQICDLLVSFRTKHSAQKKAVVWYSHLISKALHVEKRESDDRKAETVVEDLAVLGHAEGVDPDDKDALMRAALKSLGTMFDVEIIAINKFMTDPPEYELVTELGTVRLGGVKNISNQGLFRDHFADATGRFPAQRPPDRWEHVRQVILDAATIVDMGTDVTYAGSTQTRIDLYLAEIGVTEDIKDAYVMRAPFAYNDSVHIFLASFRSWVRTTFHESITTKEHGVRLRSIGATSTQVHVPGTQSTAKVWHVPTDVTGEFATW